MLRARRVLANKLAASTADHAVTSLAENEGVVVAPDSATPTIPKVAVTSAAQDVLLASSLPLVVESSRAIQSTCARRVKGERRFRCRFRSGFDTPRRRCITSGDGEAGSPSQFVPWGRELEFDWPAGT